MAFSSVMGVVFNANSDWLLLALEKQHRYGQGLLLNYAWSRQYSDLVFHYGMTLDDVTKLVKRPSSVASHDDCSVEGLKFKLCS